ncbi:hypothetical protein OWT26_28685 [Burkholderia sp. 1A5]
MADEQAAVRPGHARRPLARVLRLGVDHPRVLPADAAADEPVAREPAGDAQFQAAIAFEAGEVEKPGRTGSATRRLYRSS